jgi:hypothetical protein
VSVTTATTGTMTIQTTGSSAALRPFSPGNNAAYEITAAMLLPGSLLLLFRRRSNTTLRLMMLGVLLLGTGAVVGCGNSYGGSNPVSTTPIPGTPTGQSTVTVTATSGSITQQSTVALTVQ